MSKELSLNILEIAKKVKKLEESGGSGGGGEADDVTYDPTASHLEATNVQDAIDELSGEIAGLSADDVSYDGTDSGLSAVTVQDAIDETVNKIENLNATQVMMSDGVTSVESALTYSTTEHKVGKWIDGSDLYEKTIDFGALPDNTTKTVAHGITGLATMVHIYGFAKNPTNNIQISLPYFDTTLSDNVAFLVSATKLTIIDTSNLSIYTQSYVTLRYTKNS